MNPSPHGRGRQTYVRSGPRVYSIREIKISYEGQDEQFVVRPPNLSQRGMFINTSRTFPEGAVLNLKFTLRKTEAEIRTRCEVRYCQAGVGIGVEFIGLGEEEVRKIEREIALSSESKARRQSPRPPREPRAKHRGARLRRKS